MNRLINAQLRNSSLICALLLSSLAHADATLNLPDDRMTDQAIKADLATYTHTQERVASLNDKGIPVADYNLSKAQCWLDVSLHEYTRNDRSSFTQEALGQADGILTALETEQTPSPDTPLINNADRLREDLWQQTANLKSAKGFSCYAQKVACAEVELVHAGNEHKQQGWRHAKPYIQIAEDLISAAVATGESCLPAATAAAVAIEPPVKLVERLDIAADALFAFNKADSEDLQPEGKLKLDTLVAKLHDVYAEIEKITLVGYTDRLGNTQYNQRLSERRAHTVKAYLQTKGVTSLIDAYGRGAADQIAQCGTSTKPSKKLTDCLQVNRRVTIEVTGVKK